MAEPETPEYEFYEIFLIGTQLANQSLISQGKAYVLDSQSKYCETCMQTRSLGDGYYISQLDKVSDECLDCLFTSSPSFAAYMLTVYPPAPTPPPE
jgi:hypothetical protein